MITLKDVKFKYPKSNFTLEVSNLIFKRGEIALIVGGNGSGKTTLAKLMCGILKPDEGEVLHKGENIQDFSLGRIGKRVSFLFQEPKKQLFTSNVWSEMTFVGEMRGENAEDVARKAEELLTKFNLLGLKKRSIYHLSRGEIQRLAIACLLMNEVEFLILDEPTSGLDKENREVLFQTLENLKNNGMGIAIISHDKNVVEKFGENSVKLVCGKTQRIETSENKENEIEKLKQSEKNCKRGCDEKN